MIGRYDLARSRLLTWRDELVSSREDADQRAAVDADGAVPHGGGERQLARSKLAASGQQSISGTKIEASPPDMASFDWAGAHRHLRRCVLGVFLDDDGVCIGRNGCAGEDAYRLA